jgi:methanogenic corrinoid protein MtbC1
MHEQGQFIATVISASVKAHAAGAVERQLAAHPEIAEHYGDDIFRELMGDTEFRLLYLAEALAAGIPDLLLNQISWLKVALTARGIPIEHLTTNLEGIRDELTANLPDDAVAMPVDYLDRARTHLEQAPDQLPTWLPDGAPLVDLARRFLLAALEVRRQNALDLIRRAADDGTSVADLHRHVLTPVQAEMGRMWQLNEVHVGEEHYASTIVQQALALLRERLPRAQPNGRRVICTTVGGDLHDLGIQIVADHFEMAGWEPVFLGASTPTPDLMQAVHDFRIDLIAIAANLVLHVRNLANTIRTLRAEPACAKVPILVGGGPFRDVPELWRAVGADAGAVDAPSAVELGERLVTAAPRR